MDGMTMRMSRCRKCQGTIGWCTSVNGKQLALDPSPDPAGNVFVAVRDGRLVGIVRSKANPNPTGVCYMPHAATCPAEQRAQRSPKEAPKMSNPLELVSCARCGAQFDPGEVEACLRRTGSDLLVCNDRATCDKNIENAAADDAVERYKEQEQERREHEEAMADGMSPPWEDER